MTNQTQPLSGQITRYVVSLFPLEEEVLRNVFCTTQQAADATWEALSQKGHTPFYDVEVTTEDGSTFLTGTLWYETPLGTDVYGYPCPLQRHNSCFYWTTKSDGRCDCDLCTEYRADFGKD